MIKVHTLCLGQLQTNCYIVYDENSDEAVVVDPADSFEIIRNYLCTNNLNVKYIVITHAHYDHISALDELKKFTEAEICIGENDSQGLSDEYLNLAGFFGAPSPTSKPDILLKDGDELTASGIKFRIIHTPGHTRGGICIHFGSNLISGDTLFKASVGRTDFPGGSFTELNKSITEKLFVLNDETIVFPGHGSPTSIGYEIKNNTFIR